MAAQFTETAKEHDSEEMMSLLHLGTSSWQFDEWRGVFFPDGLAKKDQLTYYATQFDSVEVNTSFYGVPRPSTLINWIDSVPDGFTFCLKFPRAITHEKRLLGCAEETLIFLDVLRSLGEAAAPALIQLPPDFSRRQNGKQLAAYLDWLAGHLDTLRVGVEVRSADLMTPAFANFLAERGMVYVLVAREHTLDAYDFWVELAAADHTPDFALVRWLGDDRNGPTGNHALVAPRDAELDQWAGRLAHLQQLGIAVYGYMHNPYEGHSPASLRRLQGRLSALTTLSSWPPRGLHPPDGDGQSAQQMALL